MECSTPGHPVHPTPEVYLRVSEVQVEKWQYIHLMALVPVRLPLCHGGRTEVKVRVKGQDTEPPLFYVLSV